MNKLLPVQTHLKCNLASLATQKSAHHSKVKWAFHIMSISLSQKAIENNSPLLDEHKRSIKTFLGSFKLVSTTGKSGIYAKSKRDCWIIEMLSTKKTKSFWHSMVYFKKHADITTLNNHELPTTLNIIQLPNIVTCTLFKNKFSDLRKPSTFSCVQRV